MKNRKEIENYIKETLSLCADNLYYSCYNGSFSYKEITKFLNWIEKNFTLKGNPDIVYNCYNNEFYLVWSYINNKFHIIYEGLNIPRIFHIEDNGFSIELTGLDSETDRKNLLASWKDLILFNFRDV
jgi:hypothetical protein